jgi:hypothetical protein
LNASGRAVLSRHHGHRSCTDAHGEAAQVMLGWIFAIIVVAAIVFVIVWIVNIKKDKAKNEQ